VFAFKNTHGYAPKADMNEHIQLFKIGLKLKESIGAMTRESDLVFLNRSMLDFHFQLHNFASVRKHIEI